MKVYRVVCIVLPCYKRIYEGRVHSLSINNIYAIYQRMLIAMIAGNQEIYTIPPLSFYECTDTVPFERMLI